MFLYYVKRYMPDWMKSIYRKFFNLLLSNKVIREIIILKMKKEGKRYCNICGEKSFFLDPIIKEINPAVAKYDVIGGWRIHSICPKCGSLDRYRFLWYFLEKYVDFDGKKVLHFAPESILVNRIIQKVGNMNYYSGDIISGRAKYVIDITNINFNEKTFDIVIANHILEHIKDENKAVSELRRVLKQGGIAILSVPISARLEHAIEDISNELTDEERYEKFGQEDHVRIHGQDFEKYLQGFGFSVKRKVVSEILSDEEIDMMALDRRDCLFICEKI